MKAQAQTFPSERTLIDRLRDEGRVSEVLEGIQQELKKQRRRKKAAIRTAATAVLVGGALAWAIPVWKDTGRFQTAPGERSSIILADGSQVNLSARTLLKTDFRYGHRTVTLLRGEAFFQVAKNPSHPFLVTTAEGTVRVTGTQFDVRLSGGAEEVTLLEGRVAFRTGSGEMALTPGEQIGSANGKTRLRELSPAELERVTAWRDGQFILDGMSLPDAMVRAGEYFGVKIAVSPDAAEYHLGGGESLASLQDFMNGLRETHYLEVVSLPDGSYLVRKR